MSSLRVRDFDRRYRLSRSQLPMKARLDELTELLVNEHLPLALEGCGITETDEICIRRLQLALQFQPGRSDREQLLAWSSAVAQVIGRALAEGDTRNVIRYRSRLEAIVDIGRALVEHRFESYWAWNQLSLTRLSSYPTDATLNAQWLSCLERHSHLLVPAVRLLVQRQMLQPLLAGQILTPAALAHLAETAARALGLVVRWEPPASAVPEREASRSLVQRILARSEFWAALQGLLPRDEPMPLQWLFWVVAEVEPAWLSGRGAGANLNALHEALAHPLTPTDRSRTAPVETKSAAAQVWRASGEDGSEPRAAAPRRRHSVEDAAGAGFRATGYDENSGRRLVRRIDTAAEQSGTDRERGLWEVSPGQAGADSLAAPGNPIATALAPERVIPASFQSVRRAVLDIVESEFGGLLLLVNALRRFDTLASLAESDAFHDRPMAWVLEQFALALVAIPLDDPALAVFSGRSPGHDDGPSRQPAGSEPERQRLAVVAKAFQQQLGELLPATGDPTPVIIDRLCRRWARIEASAGWVDVFFSLDSVDTNLRRAGLDLDPGYVPWLGLVLRFRYQ